MKKICKTFISVFLLVVIFLCAGCTRYSSRPGKMSKLIGTYELTTYTYQEEGEEEAHDLISEEGIKCYLVITGNNKGYFYFDSNGTHLGFSDVTITYTYDVDSDTGLETDKIASLTIKSDEEVELPGGSSEQTLGFVCKLRNKNLNFTYSKSDISILDKHLNIEHKYTIKVKFTKVNQDTSKDTVKSEVGL